MAGVPLSLAIAAVMVMSMLGNVASQCPTKWIKLPYTGTPKSCSAGNKTNIVCVNSAGVVQRWNPAIDIAGSSLSTAGWISLPGAFVNVATGQDGELWAVASTGAINRWANNKWNLISGPCSGPKISVGNSKQIACISSGVMYHLVTDGGATSWQHIPGSALSLSVGNDGDTWMASSSPSGQVYHYALSFGSCWDFIGAPPLTQITVADKDHVYGSNAAGYIYHRLSTGAWTQCPGFALESIYAGKGILAVVSSGGVYMGVN